MTDDRLSSDSEKATLSEKNASDLLMDTAAADGLRFFGRISASISHELKNTLSIMNESAGLLEDLSLLAEKGKPLDANRVKELGATIKRQIQRTDQIIRNMNRFSHTVDEPLKEVELGEFLEFILTVCRRLMSVKGVAAAIQTVDQPLMIVSRPFFLHGLLWSLLEFGMEWVGPSKTLTMSAEKKESGFTIQLTGLENLPPDAGQRIPTQQEQTLLNLLEARMTINFEEKSLLIALPQRIVVSHLD